MVRTSCCLLTRFIMSSTVSSLLTPSLFGTKQNSTSPIATRRLQNAKKRQDFAFTSAEFATVSLRQGVKNTACLGPSRNSTSPIATRRLQNAKKRQLDMELQRQDFALPLNYCVSFVHYHGHEPLSRLICL